MISPKLYVFAPYRVELSEIPIHEHPIGYVLNLLKSSIHNLFCSKLKKKLKKFCSCETYSDIRSINLKNTAMKKQEMIDLILQEERKLWNDLQYMIDVLGVNDEATESATTRWATIHQLIEKLGLK